MTLLQVDKDIEKKMRMKSKIDVRTSVRADAEGGVYFYVVP